MPARLRALVTVLCAVVLGALLPAATAHATSRTVQGGRLDWGVRSSFQSYVTGPVAKGSYSLTGGAATVGSSRFRFPSATGAYDAATGAFTASFAGGVHFVGHRESDGGYRLDLTLSRPTVRISGSAGTLYLDVTGKAKGTGTVTTSTQVPFASLALGGLDMKGAGTAVVLNNVPATLTARGAESFAGYYTAGTALDPVSLAADVEPARTSTPTPPPASSKSPTGKATSKAGALADGAVDWGVRRTFREYVTGDIARGSWTLTGGAEDGGALFRFPKGEGTYRNGALTARFAGAVRFIGDRGLDLRLSAVRVAVQDGTGTLSADVDSDAFTADRVPLVTFTAGGLTVKKGLAEVVEAPAKLTARGARAFAGMYRAGTAMDPVSLAVALTADATLPALPDLGSAAEETETPAPATASARPVASDTTASDGDGAPVLPVVLTAGVLSAAAALLAVAVRRRRTRPAAGQPAPADED
ncbi:HtaA domain-containing protein [Streptomyces fuscichromogenes]|uniref:HtaA domain-containing protein n=1 Tax=Streptomyces fuscichromogenes TaxID=1324013 RepID=UPI0037F72143